MKNKVSFLRFSVLLLLIVYDFIHISAAENVKKSVDETMDDNGDNDESKYESMGISVDNEPTNLTCTRRQNSIMHEISAARHKQFPFMAAIMSHQNEYLCAGSIVSNGLILTTAQCTQHPLSYVLLNTTKDKKDETTVMLHITKTEKFPTFMGAESLKDVGLVYTEKHNSSVASKIKLSNYTSSRNIVDLEAVGFGLNAEVGQAKELQYVGLEQRALLDHGEILKTYFDCVDTKVLTCFKDTGGPAIYDNELIGIVVKGEDECTKEMSNTYAVNKRMADILPTYTFKAWLDERIKKNEEQDITALSIYPIKPVTREHPKVHKMTSLATLDIAPTSFLVVLSLIILVF